MKNFKEDEKLNILNHSCAHLLAHALKHLYPDAKFWVGPVKEEALEMFKDDPYKIDLISRMDESETVITAYKQDDFIDLCRGPHMPTTKSMKYFKLLKVSGAYWKGDAKNKMLQRIYGVCFENEEDLNKHLEMLEEAKLRDLEYFADDEDIYGVINENKNDYTVESWDAKKDLIDELNNIVSGNSDMELKDITQEFVDGKMKEIEATKLVAKELDRTKYEEQINKFDSLVEEDYEADSWQIAETSRNQSIENVKIQSKLNEITYRIEQDIKNLVPANFERYVTTTVLQLQMKLWDYIRSDYTNESYNEAQDKINNLKYQTI